MLMKQATLVSLSLRPPDCAVPLHSHLLLSSLCLSSLLFFRFSTSLLPPSLPLSSLDHASSYLFSFWVPVHHGNEWEYLAFDSFPSRRLLVGNFSSLSSLRTSDRPPKRNCCTPVEGKLANPPDLRPSSRAPWERVLKFILSTRA